MNEFEYSNLSKYLVDIYVIIEGYVLDRSNYIFHLEPYYSGKREKQASTR